MYIHTYIYIWLYIHILLHLCIEIRLFFSVNYEILGRFLFAQLELRKGQTAMLMAANNDLPVVAKTLIMGNADVNQAKSAISDGEMVGAKIVYIGNDFIDVCYITGWWFGTLEFLMTFHVLGMSSSQLTKSIIFQSGRSTTNQINISEDHSEMFMNIYKVVPPKRYKLVHNPH